MNEEERNELASEIKAVRQNEWQRNLREIAVWSCALSLVISLGTIMELRRQRETLHQQITDVIKERDACQAAMKARDEK